MAYGPWLVELPATSPRVNNIKACVVFADNSADAKLLAKGANPEGADDTYWANATATAITAEANWTGWTLEIVIGDGNDKRTFSVTGFTTLDLMASAMLTQMTAAGLAGVTYDATTQILNLPGALGLGAKNRTARIHKNGGTFTTGAVATVAVAAAASSMQFTMPTDAITIPGIYVVGNL